jgi:hypothetical protein
MLRITIIIAGVECLILCEDEELFGYFREAYKPFLGHARRPVFTFVFQRTRDKRGAVLGSSSIQTRRSELAIGDTQNTSHVFLFNYLFKIAFARLYITKKYGLLLHASSVAHRGRAIVIAGDKGAGKSTSLQVLRNNGFISLSDDVALLNITGTSVRVYASPFYERHDFSKTNMSAIITSVFFLHRTDGNNHVTELNMVKRVNALYYHSYAWGFGQFADNDTMKTLRIMAYQIASSVRCFDMYLRTIDDGVLRFYPSL